jgi:hypothetical protein
MLSRNGQAMLESALRGGAGLFENPRPARLLAAPNSFSCRLRQIFSFDAPRPRRR